MTNAERRAYEECAKIAEKYAAELSGMDDSDQYREDAADMIAQLIRAAIPPREEEKPADAINA